MTLGRNEEVAISGENSALRIDAIRWEGLTRFILQRHHIGDTNGPFLEPTFFQVDLQNEETSWEAIPGFVRNHEESVRARLVGNPRQTSHAPTLHLRTGWEKSFADELQAGRSW